MSMSVRRAGAIAAAVCLCAAAPPTVHAQDGGMGKPFSEEPLKGGFPGGKGAQETPTATPETTPDATATRTPTPTPTPEASPEPTATAGPGKGGKRDKGDLPATGSDALEIGLAGLTLLGFGISLRLRVALADARRPV